MKKDLIVKKKRGKIIEDPMKQNQIEIIAIKLAFNSIIKPGAGEARRLFLVKKFCDKCLNGKNDEKIVPMIIIRIFE